MPPSADLGLRSLGHASWAIIGVPNEGRDHDTVFENGEAPLRHPHLGIVAALTMVVGATPDAYGSGDVTATRKGKDLIITGDSSSNRIALEESGNEIVVIGLGSTTVNGEDEVEFKVGDDIKIRMKGGNDEVYLYEMEVPGDLLIKGNGGHDDIYLIDVEIDDDLVIVAGSGDDRVVIDYVDVGDRSTIKVGRGDDEAVFRDTWFDGDVKFNGGDDEDFLRIDHSDFDDDVEIDMGDDDDELWVLNNTDFHEDADLDGDSDDDLIWITIGSFFFPIPKDVDIDDFEQVHF